ncbi:hypothetical protein SAMN05444274_11455 [Mariniphaga anaerophila]|uniref:AAA+ ATPase domain-containing protein n=1 Tax=Mariniphaga anaerophila TaxID=1484053 RepID=A0A1M5FT06_9BACT|nr:ATP-binding protein [Mariniphaga anaerophila]SHF94665.1 hypothetical protein SAMN05444274_11455 [Mariniphaga anaerophila]
MIKKSDLETVIHLQKERFLKSTDEIERELLQLLPLSLSNHALIISGVRRCGKSTLIKQLVNQEPSDAFYINFDTPKLYEFEINDFEVLDQIIYTANPKKLYFDEIQVVLGWELYVRQKLDEGYQVLVTGSNASLLSKELGTKLTGRHITKELFPFSYVEFIRFKKIESGIDSFRSYFRLGGFPEYVKHESPEILTSLFDDILFRDIAVRHGVRDVKSLQRLLLYLVANVGSLITATRLATLLGIKSSATVLDYLSYFEQSWILGLLPKFSWSYRARLVNPRKVYIIDNGLVNAVSPSFSENNGRKLENCIYWFLRQKQKEIFYFNETGHECDFVTFKNNKVEEVIQVCYHLEPENRAREENGLLAAMDFFNLNNGTIITMDQSDIIQIGEKRINVIPAYKFSEAV